jgi:4-hydroxybenzoate polyprenyltransferase
MRLYRYLNAFSIDVVVGAVICSLFFAKLLQTYLPAVLVVTLAMAVWSVYTIDHLWDAQRSPMPSITLRHHLHFKYRPILAILLFAVLVIGGVLFWYLPDSTRKMGLILAVSIMIYFLTTTFRGSKPIYHKELSIAAAYSFGVILGPYTLRQIQMTTPHMLVCIQFAMLAFSNLLIFSYFDTELDQKQHFGSLSRSIGKWNARLLAMVMLSLVLVTSIFGFINWYEDTLIRQSQWVLALMTIPLAITLVWYPYFRQCDRYRLLGDITFFVPILIL